MRWCSSRPQCRSTQTHLSIALTQATNFSSAFVHTYTHTVCVSRCLLLLLFWALLCRGLSLSLPSCPLSHHMLAHTQTSTTPPPFLSPLAFSLLPSRSAVVTACSASTAITSLASTSRTWDAWAGTSSAPCSSTTPHKSLLTRCEPGTQQRHEGVGGRGRDYRTAGLVAVAVRVGLGYGKQANWACLRRT